MVVLENNWDGALDTTCNGSNAADSDDTIKNYDNTNAKTQPIGYRFSAQSESTGYVNNFLYSFPKEVQCIKSRCKSKYKLI